MEPHLLPTRRGALVNVKNDPRARRRMDALGFWPMHVTPGIVTYRLDNPGGGIYTYGYDPITDTEGNA